MTPTVLVAYGSRHGSTADIARAIGDALRKGGLAAEARPAGEVHEVGSYDAVVLGDALSAGRWHRDVRRLARRQREQLTARPVWLFSSGPLDAGAAGREVPCAPGVRRVAERLHVRGHVTFEGRLNETAAGRTARTVRDAGKGGGVRDLDVVTAWAEGIARELAAMSPRDAPVPARVRWWRWRRNPLRRRCDLVEAWTRLLLAAVLLLGAPATGAVAAFTARDSAQATADAQRQSRHRVSVTLTEDAPLAARRANGSMPTRQAPVRWRDPDGTSHTGFMKVPAGTRRGEPAQGWLDARGRVTTVPLDGDAITQRALAAGAGAALGVVLLALALHRLQRWVAQRRRMAEWQLDWERVGPEWTSRRT